MVQGQPWLRRRFLQLPAGQMDGCLDTGKQGYTVCQDGFRGPTQDFRWQVMEGAGWEDTGYWAGERTIKLLTERGDTAGARLGGNVRKGRAGGQWYCVAVQASPAEERKV